MDGLLSSPVLCFDTALGGVSAGVFVPGGVRAVKQIETLRDQASILVPTMNALLKEAGVEYADLSRIITSRGPGSFTGLRIGLTTARCYGLALNIPVIGVSTLEAAAAHVSNMPVLAALETKRKDFYVQDFDARGNALSEAAALLPKEIEDFVPPDQYILVGDACDRFQEAMAENWRADFIIKTKDIKLLDPDILMQVGLKVDLKKAPAEPIYLRGADVSQPKTPPRQLKQ